VRAALENDQEVTGIGPQRPTEDRMETRRVFHGSAPIGSAPLETSSPDGRRAHIVHRTISATAESPHCEHSLVGRSGEAVG